MKYPLLLIAFFLALTACEKSTVSTKTLPENLTGKWNYTQSFYSPGGPLVYISTDDLHQWIDFKADGSFSSNMPRFQDVTSYEVLDSVKIKLLRPASQSSERFFAQIDPASKKLTLTADFICIEGCGSRFKR